ncbi:MAG: hypothetical protein WBE76_21830 [Terracidiphilus sp.]
MTIQIEISPETAARLAALAAARRMDVPAYAATLLERATENESQCEAARSARQRHSGRKSLAQLFADSPFKGLDVDFERDPDIGRDIAL